MLALAPAQQRLGRPGRPRKAPLEEQAAAAVTPATRRLLDVRRAAAYCGVSPRIVYEWKAAGYLVPVVLPRAGDRPIGKLLFDLNDLDRFIERHKETPR